IMPMSTATEMAAESGVNSVNFGFMVEDTGEPYGIEQALSLLRRGLISEGDFTRVLYYSRVRNEFLGQVLQLAHDTMSPGDAIEGALKGVLDAATARDLFEKGGGLGEQFDTLLNITGNPIGVQEANTLFNHGLITDAELTQVILHSRVNPIFEPMAKLLRHRFLAPFQVSQALKAGAATSAEATSWLLADGYPADQVAAVVAEGFGVKVAKHKDLTEAQITQLYDSGLWTHDTATQHLAALGYDPGETDFILAVYDQRRELTMAQAAINQVRKVFLAKRIDASAASAMLGSLGVDATAQADYLAIWTVEQESELRELSMAQVGGILKKGGIDDAGAVARWVAMGYSPEDAALLLFDYGGPPPAGSPAANAPAGNTPTTGA
ncbi:MAG: hypothetical protein ACREQ5_13245, partial [Candidatus Dormibacteria bacterium]